jgi:hypothetical protein
MERGETGGAGLGAGGFVFDGEREAWHAGERKKAES